MGVDEKGRERFTSKSMLDLEYKMLRQAESLGSKARIKSILRNVRRRVYNIV
ncbi:hypothetical protein MIDIC_140008 [Alphaproteobacteria bacterium]